MTSGQGECGSVLKERGGAGRRRGGGGKKRGREKEKREKEWRRKKRGRRRGINRRKMRSKSTRSQVVLTEASEQWSISPLLKRAMSLMKTAVALRMKDMKRCMWM